MAQAITLCSLLGSNFLLAESGNPPSNMSGDQLSDKNIGTFILARMMTNDGHPGKAKHQGHPGHHGHHGHPEHHGHCGHHGDNHNKKAHKGHHSIYTTNVDRSGAKKTLNIGDGAKGHCNKNNKGC